MSNSTISLITAAHNYAVQYISTFMSDSKVDPLIITSIVLELIRTNEDLETIEDSLPRDIIHHKYTKIVEDAVKYRLDDADMCFEFLADKNLEFVDIPEDATIQIYTDALNMLIKSDPDVYETTGYIHIEEKINPIVKEIALEFLKKVRERRN